MRKHQAPTFREDLITQIPRNGRFEYWRLEVSLDVGAWNLEL
jgi:hypothetical protein